MLLVRAGGVMDSVMSDANELLHGVNSTDSVSVGIYLESTRGRSEGVGNCWDRKKFTAVL